MYCYSLDAINHSDAVVAILDGADSDSGTCIEIGYAKAKGKLIIEVRTDFRSGEDRGLNLMVSNICSHLVTCPSTSVFRDPATLAGVRRVGQGRANQGGPSQTGQPSFLDQR